MYKKTSLIVLTMSSSLLWPSYSFARERSQTSTQNLNIDLSPSRCQDLSQRQAKQHLAADRASDAAFPEPASGYRSGLKAQYASKYMAVSNTPLATQAGCEVLATGGSAVDAVIAVQAVLGLVEPQSSSIAGSAFMLYFDAKTKKVSSYDGRETAPAAATPYYLLRQNQADAQSVAPVPSARRSGRSIGVPGVMKMLEMAHQEHGRLAWSGLFNQAITLSTQGFRVPGRLADAIVSNSNELKLDRNAMQTYFKPSGQPYKVGEIMTNIAYADSLKKIAEQGAQAMYSGPMAESIVAKAGQTIGDDAARTPITPSLMTLADLSHYKAVKREAICASYREQYYICSMPPPSSGGIAVLQTLGILENFDLKKYAPTQKNNEGGIPNVMAVHLVAEAERLAYADRDKYIADSDFVALPGKGIASLLDKSYLKQRAALINPDRSMGVAKAGEFATQQTVGIDKTQERGTTQITVVDSYGNVSSVTSTVESSMGSFHMVDGFLLSNQLTDFAENPVDEQGAVLANRVEANKRPRSTMAPTLVFRGNQPGDLYIATGSPGGGTIIQFVVKNLVAMLDWKLDPQQANALVNFGAMNSTKTNVDHSNPQLNLQDLVKGLEAKGHVVNSNAQTSGVSTIMRMSSKKWLGKTQQQLIGGVDPRREGLALGDTSK